MDRLEERVERLAGSTPAELLGTIEGLRCALRVVERRVRECEAKQELLSEAVARLESEPTNREGLDTSQVFSRQL